MEYRPLGKTGAQISAIGLGTEYLYRQPRETVVSVVQEAVEQGVNFLDILFTVSEYLENLRAGLEGRRDRVLLAAHLGSGEKDGQTASVWEKGECLRFFDKTLSGLGADYADIVFIHIVDNEQLLTRWLPEMLEAAERLRAQGKVRWIGMTSHKAEIALRAVNDGRIEVLLFPINLAGHSIPGKELLFQACMQQGVGLVAMKPYAGGLLLAPFHSAYMHWYLAGGEFVEMHKREPLTPVQCLSYVLDQTGVASAIPGVSSPEQLRAALAYLSASEQERDWRGRVDEFNAYVPGECQYCNHCLPCPAQIDVGQVIRLADQARAGVTEALRAAYQALAVKASACQVCGQCMSRCPFKVHIIDRMFQAAALFQ